MSTATGAFHLSRRRKGVMMRRLTLSKLALPALIVGLAAATTGVFASTATGNASGCTLTSTTQYVCIYVYGSGTYVNRVSVVRQKLSSIAICNYQGLMNVWNSSGTLIDRRWSPFHSGCSYGRAWFDWYPAKNYPNNSSVCTYFYEGYGKLQGVACKKIYA